MRIGYKGGSFKYSDCPVLFMHGVTHAQVLPFLFDDVLFPPSEKIFFWEKGDLACHPGVALETAFIRFVGNLAASVDIYICT